MSETPPDLVVRVESVANVAAVEPVSSAGRTWLADLEVEPWQRLGESVGVDVRIIPRLIDHATNDGLTVAAW